MTSTNADKKILQKRNIQKSHALNKNEFVAQKENFQIYGYCKQKAHNATRVACLYVDFLYDPIIPSISVTLGAATPSFPGSYSDKGEKIN